MEQKASNYTKWQRQYFDGKSDEELRKDIKDFCKNHSYKGKAQVL